MRGVTGVVMALVALSASPLWAQDDLQQQLDALRKEVETLKQERTLNQTQPIEAEAAKKGEASAQLQAAPQAQPNPLVTLFKETTVSGFVDAGYNFNNRQPAPQTNSLRAFDTQANSFTLHNAQLNFERLASEGMIFGYRIELMAGSDFDAIDGTRVTGTDSNGDTLDLSSSMSFGVQEAYAQIIVPQISGLDIRVGKLATLAGSEVIESRDDLNYSRGLLFTWAIPFTHTGVRVAYQPMEQLKVTLGYVNGWDNNNDNNNAKTLEFQVAVTPVQNISAYVNIYHGAEQNDEDGLKRTLLDIVLLGTFGPVTVGANADWGREEFDDNDLTVTGDDTALWNGWAIYGKYQIVDWFAPVVRIERFRDEDGERTGTHQSVWEFTLTLDFRIGKNLIVRLEYRHDDSTKESFNRHGHTREQQDTIGAEVIVTF